MHCYPHFVDFKYNSVSSFNIKSFTLTCHAVNDNNNATAAAYERIFSS